ncbi:unnamed protein product [Moneuplotes crassus]|uniref:Uncharacterized protein n=2 Tax=Euplotes crassus TaxID=5936 RepID=A0AAD1Y6U4_EUPCR|nr:unnamed protein product [Moneuplotes crassus]
MNELVIPQKSVDRQKDVGIKLKSVLRIRDEPILDTMQTHCKIERILFYSDSCTVISDMKSKQKVVSCINADLLIRIAISLTEATKISRNNKNKHPSNRFELAEELDVLITRNKDMTATNTKSDRQYNGSTNTRQMGKSSMLHNDTLANNSLFLENENAYFSNRIELTLFAHKLISISHDNYGLILICSLNTDSGWANILCMYMFLQYYRNFGKKILQEFYQEDSFIKEQELSMVSGREALRSVSGMYSAMSISHSQLLEKPIQELPFGEMMENIKETFGKVFVEERPDVSDKYYLSGLTLIQIATTRLYDTLFNFNFTKETSKNINYSSSDLTKKLMKKILKHIGGLENFQTENQNDENGPSVKIQMYEFFFSHTLIKAMQIPFMDHTFMLGFFEKNLKKREKASKRHRDKRRAYKKKEHQEERSTRTIKLRQFYEFFSMLFDQKLFTPFSQFLTEESYKSLKKILKKKMSTHKKTLVGNNSSKGDIKACSRARSKMDKITPLGYKNDGRNQHIFTNDGKDMEIKEDNSSGEEEELKATSRFGEKLAKTIDQQSKDKSKIFPMKEENEDFSDSNIEDIKKVIEGEIPDDTLSLSNITKEKPKKIDEKKVSGLDKFNSSQMRKGDFSNISKIDKQNISGLSHSYDMFTNSNITPLQQLREKSSLVNNRYAIMNGISKSELSTSFIKQKIERSDLGDSRNDYTPPPHFGGGAYPKIDPDAHNALHKSLSRSRDHNMSKSHSSAKGDRRTSNSRIFQPTPQKIHDGSN